MNGYVENELANVHKFFSVRYKENIGSQDGGVATGILKTLFKQGKIDCAVGVTRDENWETKVVLLTSAQDVERIKGTKYTSDPVIAALREAFEKYERIADIGVPCKTHSARLIRENINEKIVLIIGLLCMETFLVRLCLRFFSPK